MADKSANGYENAPVVRTLSDLRPLRRQDEVSASESYIGWAPSNAAEDQPLWRIQKIVKSGTVTRYEYPRGDDGFNFKWADRTTYNYV